MNNNEKVVLDRFKALLSANIGPHKLILFGSRARGDADPDSDLDVLVVLDNRPTGREQGILTILIKSQIKTKNASGTSIAIIIFPAQKTSKTSPEYPHYPLIDKLTSVLSPVASLITSSFPSSSLLNCSLAFNNSMP